MTARCNLARLLNYTRQALPDVAVLQTSQNDIRLNPNLAFSDSCRFQTLSMANGTPAAEKPRGRESTLEEAIALYGGSF